MSSVRRSVRTRAWLAGPLLAAIAAAVSPASALAGEPRLASDRAGASEVVLVEVAPSATTVAKREVRQRLGVAARDVTVYRAGWRAYRLDGPLTAVETRARLAGAAAAGRVEVAQEVYASAVPNDPDWGLLWGLHDIGASSAWDDHGAPQPVVVAVTDTGVQTSHPDLAGAVWTNPGETPGNGIDDDANGFVDDVSGWDFRADDNSVYDDTDDDHGTHVAGTIAATRNNATGIAGVADNVAIMPLKFLGGPARSGSTSDAVAAIDYAVANGAKVINASWGGGYSHAVCDAVAAATAAGVVMVSAAGNGGSDGIGDDVDGDVFSPASCAVAGNVAVAALDSGGGLAGFSNYGATRVDLGAPGVSIRSTVPVGGYASWSGTSMAAPHVAGAAALLLGLEPGLTPAEVEDRIRATGTPTASLGGLTVSGRRLSLAGLVASAIADSDRPGPPALVGPAPGALVAGASVRFSWSAPADPGGGVAGYDLEVGGSPVASTGAGATHLTRPLSDGSHRWTVVAKGSMAGATRAPETRTVTVDTTPPPPFVVAVPADTRDSPPIIRWAATDATSGIASYSVRLDGAVVATGGSSLRAYRPPSRLAGGSHTVSVTATDRAGHARTSAATFTYTPRVSSPTPPARAGDGAGRAALRPAPRRGRVLARGGRILIPVAASSVRRGVRLRATVRRGRRTTARTSRAARIAPRARYMALALPPRALRARGRMVVRWRSADASLARRWYGRSVPAKARRAALRQRRRAIALSRATAKRRAAAARARTTAG